MLKLEFPERGDGAWVPAAFRRLCVETLVRERISFTGIPAAFRRLCVETRNGYKTTDGHDPAAFRRLCVETYLLMMLANVLATSRLQAAVC